LSPEFKDAFWKPGEALTPRLCQHYQLFTRATEVPKLFEMIGVVREEGTTKDTRSRGNPAAAGQVETRGIVEWPDAPSLEKRFTWERTPTPREVRLAQEDLWVYQALLEVIKRTNGTAKRHDTAAVKKIDTLRIAQDASREGIGSGGGRARDSRDRGRGRDTYGRVGGMGGPAYPTVKSPSGTTNTTSEDESKPELAVLENRYVDGQGKPLAASAAPPFEEYNLMPFAMRMVVDQRRIATLLTEFARSGMPIEVRVLDFQGKDPPPAGEGATPGSGAPKGPRGSRPGTEEKSVSPFDVTLDVQGVVYIFNPPDKKAAESAGQEKVEVAPAEGKQTPGEKTADSAGKEKAETAPADGKQTPGEKTADSAGQEKSEAKP